MSLKDYIILFTKYLEEKNTAVEPKNLYEPMQYILQLGGKRLRPVLTLVATEGYGRTVNKGFSAAMAIEIFHNFTLLHDDVMDRADVRRGQPTVHNKWNQNTAILSGDVMMIKAYQYLNSYEADVFKHLTQLLSQTAIEVCEGQQYDMDFENKDEVSLPEYLEMIRLKTAVLIGAALKMGGIVAGIDAIELEKLYDFGIQTGLAFQMQDDYLDTFGDVATFGKEIGGDIKENKKTWLYLKTLELADENDQMRLIELYSEFGTESNRDNKYELVKNLYLKYDVPNLIQREMQHYSTKATQILNELKMNPIQKSILQDLLLALQYRNN